MRNFVIFLIIGIIYNFGKETIAEDVKECPEFKKVHFKQLEGTSGNYDDVIIRRNQFVVLKKEGLTIFEDYSKPIIDKHFPVSSKRLNLDLFENILFTSENRLAIYIPENDELIWKGHSRAISGKLAFDDNNTIYVIAEGRLSYVKSVNNVFTFLPRLEQFKNLTHLVDGDRNNFYFAYDSEKTSWIVNGVTEQTIMQTTSIKYLNYVSDNHEFANGTIYLIDQNCTLKALKVSPSLTVYKHSIPKLIKIMHFEDCDYREGAEFIFRPENINQLSYIFNKNKIYRLSEEDGSNKKMCLHGKLDNVTINAGAVNRDYIMLATSDGLWASKW